MHSPKNLRHVPPGMGAVATPPAGRKRALAGILSLWLLAITLLSAAPKPPLEDTYDLAAALDAASAFAGRERAGKLSEVGTELFQRGRFTDAIEILNEALSLAEGAEDIALQSSILQKIGKTEVRREELAGALKAAERGRALAFETDDAVLKSKALLLLANVFAILRDYGNSLQYSLKSLKFAEGAEDPGLEGKVLNNIAIVYWQMGDFTRSEAYLRRALDDTEGSDRFHFLLINNIGVALMEQGKLDEAGAYLKQAYAHFESAADEFFLALIESNFADLAERRGQSEEALERCATALEIATRINNQYVRTRTYRHQGNALVDLDRQAEAEAAYRRSIETARLIHDPAEEMQTWQCLIDLFENAGRYEEALAAHRSIQTIRENILSRQVRYQSIFLETQFDISRKEQEIALLNQQRNLAELAAAQKKLEAEKSEREMVVMRHQRTLTVLALVFSILCLALLYNRIRFKQRALAKIEAQHSEIEASHHELERANEALKALNREKDEILSIAAHDLQTPLVAQRGFAELLQRGWQDLAPAEIAEMTAAIASAADNMAEIIRNLLDSHRLDQGVVPIEPRPIDPRKPLQEAVAQIAPVARSKHQSLELDLPAQLPALQLDPIAFDRILQNLLSNAVKYSPPAHPIHILARVEDDRAVSIAIRDEGPGISLEEQPRIFEKFARISNRTTAGEASIGLGLSIVKKLTELQNGEITCHSKPGEGSTFTVRFPIGTQPTSARETARAMA